ncbi:MAG: uracil-DNA glycosylase [Rhodospirillaceae bacterium]|nr:uracil-DNA glycosylase [Rhodospirillaceae bacterium]
MPRDTPTPDTPAGDCQLCPRLAEFRHANRAAFPDWHNNPVPAFGGLDAQLLVVGLAPGLRGANRTGRPFTGDYAGELLYPSLLKFGRAKGAYGVSIDDGLKLVDTRITNAVRCVPPENKPTPLEQKTCRRFLVSEIAAMPRLTSILVLGRIAHDAVLSTLGLRKVLYPFGHGVVHSFDGKLSMTDSYHCSRYNVNTGVLTEAMFHGALNQAINAINRKA